MRDGTCMLTALTVVMATSLTSRLPSSHLLGPSAPWDSGTTWVGSQWGLCRWGNQSRFFKNQLRQETVSWIMVCITWPWWEYLAVVIIRCCWSWEMLPRKCGRRPVTKATNGDVERSFWGNPATSRSVDHLATQKVTFSHLADAPIQSLSKVKSVCCSWVNVCF